MAFLTKAQIDAKTQRQITTEPSPVFGGDLCLRELGRMDHRAASTAAAIPDRPGYINIDTWHAAVFAWGVVDPQTHEPLYEVADILSWVDREGVFAEVSRIALLILAFSEVGPDALTKSGDGADAG